MMVEQQIPAPQIPLDPQLDADRRSGVRRTALLFAAIAVVIYVGFILSGVLAGGS